MNCPLCQGEETKVLDSRVFMEGTSIRRRRECLVCKYRFSTREELEELEITVVKNNGQREIYDRDKLERGLLKSLSKIPYTKESFRGLINSIEKDIRKKKIKEIKSSEIGEVVMDALKTFNKVAYIRFASIYRSFKDVGHFKKAIDSLQKKS